MTTPTYDFLGEVIMAGTESSVTLSGIDQSYSHLVVEGQWDSSSYAQFQIRFNSVSTQYSYLTYGQQAGSLVGGYEDATAPEWQPQYANNLGGGVYPAAFRIELPNYTKTDRKRTAFWQQGVLGRHIFRGMGYSQSTEAISSLTFKLNTGTFSSKSYVRLYGIAGG